MSLNLYFVFRGDIIVTGQLISPLAFMFQGIGGAKSNNGIQYKLIVVYANGERIPPN